MHVVEHWDCLREFEGTVSSHCIYCIEPYLHGGRLVSSNSCIKAEVPTVRIIDSQQELGFFHDNVAPRESDLERDHVLPNDTGSHRGRDCDELEVRRDPIDDDAVKQYGWF